MVETRGLGKSYGLSPVLREVELRLDAGRGAAIIGGNGSGKSTLLRMIAGLEAPTTGCALVFGHDARRLDASMRRRIGVLAHQSFLYPNLTARENLEFYAELYRVAAPRSVASEWLDRVGLTANRDTRVRAFSRGMEQRLAVARAMLHRPELILLDEPFASLDEGGVKIVSGLMREALERGAGVIVSAHREFEIEGVAFDGYEIARGRVAPMKAAPEAPKVGRMRSLLGR